MSVKHQAQASLMDMLKVLSDESRLKLLRLLNEEDYTVGDLARLVALSEPTVSHHLARLREVGLATLRMAGTQRFYRLNAAGLAKFKQMVNEIEQSPTIEPETISDNRWIEALGWEAEDQAILVECTVNGRLVRLPKKQKKLLVVLRWLATLFEAERQYTEREINAILQGVHVTDYVSLRRDLVNMGYLRRERGGGKYWLASADEPPNGKGQ